MADTLFLAVFAYDVSDDGDRRRVAELLEQHLVRVQGSVFEGWMTVKQAHDLLAQAQAMTDASDSVRCYLVPRAQLRHCRAAGYPPAPIEDGVLIL